MFGMPAEPYTKTLARVLHARRDTLHGDDHGVLNAGLVGVLVSTRVVRVTVQQAGAVLVDGRVVCMLLYILSGLDGPYCFQALHLRTT